MASSIITDPIGNALQRSFHNGSFKNGNSSYGLMPGGSSSSINSASHLDSSLQLASKKTQIANSTVQFDPPERYVGNMDSVFKGPQTNGASNGISRPKIIVLNPPKQGQTNGVSTKGASGAAKAEANTIPRPKIVFFDPSSVMVSYRQHRSAGSGMHNMGNTCYLNSTLQALFHTPALYNFLMGNNAHVSKCNGGQGNNSFIQSCIMCAMTHTLRDTLRSNVIKPNKVYDKLKAICKHLVHGRQEDAHEFLRYLIESLQRSYLVSERAQLKTLDTPSKETTPFNQIFGGYMRQNVTCLRCKYVSTTFQHFMDLLLDIRQVSNIEDALQQHFKQERIGGNSENADSMYKCEKCHVKVPAKKQSLIEQPPAVLCIQLKRFSLLGGKISKPVQLSRIINMKQFINTSGHGASTTNVQYKLVSMITHVGPSANCGHYTAIGEAANGQFFQFDDSSVRPISVGQAMNTASYVVFYEMTKPSWDRRLNPNTSTPITPTGVLSTNGTAKPSSQVGPSINGVARPSPQIGPKVIAQPGSQMTSIKPKLISTISSHATPVTNKLGVVATALKRNIISAATNTSTPATTTCTSSTNGTWVTPTKPIAATSTSSSATNTKLPTLAKITNGHGTYIKNGGLVLYDDDSDSESPPNNSSKEATKSTSIKPEFSTVPRSVNLGLDKVVAVQEPKASLPTEAGHTVPVAVHKSASGTWHITDVDHHNPSIASDGSCGSTSGKWIVTPAPANNVKICEGPKATSSWTVTPLLKKSLLALEPVQKLSEQAIDDPNYPIEPVSRVKEPVLVRVSFPVTQARKRGSMDDSYGDDYDAEFDRGRTKKVRKAIIAPSNSFNSQDPMSNRNNPFQSAQSQLYQNQNSDLSGPDRHQNRPWQNRGGQNLDQRFQHNHSRSRSNSSFGNNSCDGTGRRKSFGGQDFRDSHKRHISYNNGHHRGGSSNGYNRSFSGQRGNDFNNRNGYRNNR